MIGGNICLKESSHAAVPSLQLCSKLQHELFPEDHHHPEGLPPLLVIPCSQHHRGQPLTKTTLRIGRILPRDAERERNAASSG